MSYLRVLRANGRDRARHVVEMRLHADSDSGQEAVVLRRTTFCPGSNRLFEVQLHVGHDFKLYSSDGVELVISIGDLTYMLIPVTHTQRWVLERPPGGHIADDYTLNILRVWNPQGGHTDLPLKFPRANPTPGQGNQEENVRDGEFADTGKVVFSIRRFKKLQKDYDATSQPTTILVQNTDHPDDDYDEWMSQNPTLLREVRKLIIRSDYINGLGGVNGRIYRYVVEILPDPTGVTKKPLAHPMGGLPSGPQLSQEAEAWGVATPPHAGLPGMTPQMPSSFQHPMRQNQQPECNGFTQTAPPRGQRSDTTAQTPMSFASDMRQNQRPACNEFAQTAQTPRSFAPNMRQNQQEERNQFGMPILTHEDVHRAGPSRPSVRRSRGSLPAGPMDSHRGRNGGGIRSDFHHRPPVAPGTEASQTPPASQPAMPQSHGTNGLREVPQSTTPRETIEIPSSSSSDNDDDGDKLDERRNRRRIN
ncbi:hypothetical protein D0859_12336 [Hortaea werneckii]|uniref:Uncharacterized protein n=1 Tax=Hortaea werneckii TaxID=91943 RepID=A0A3M7IEA4_HORWE|nr:hypothetical protein D0859_12336 [Hortaea werneckii]